MAAKNFSYVDQGIVLDNGANAYYPTLIYDPTFKYKCFYTTGTALKVVTSTDAITWSAAATPTGLSSTTHHPHVAYDHTAWGAIKYKIWYWNSSVSNLLISTIRYAESEDGLTWTNDQSITQDGTYKIITGSSGDWNAATWGFIKVIYNATATNTGTNPFDYSYVAYYDANTGTTYQNVGLAYSSDGLNWYSRQTQPVLSRASSDAGAWDYYCASFGTVIKETSGYHFWYTGGKASGNTDNNGFGYAFSSDGLSFVKGSIDPVNPIMTVSDGETYRDERCYTPAVIFDGENYMIIYTAQGTAQTGRKKLGLVVATPNVLTPVLGKTQSRAVVGGTNQTVVTDPDVVTALPMADSYLQDKMNVFSIDISFKHSSGAVKSIRYENSGNGEFAQTSEFNFHERSRTGSWDLSSIILTDYDGLRSKIAVADLPVYGITLNL